MSDIGSRVRNVSPRLREDALMIITIEQGVLGLAAAVPPILSSRSGSCAIASTAHTVGLEACLLEDNDQTALLGVLRRGAGLDGDHGGVRDDRGGTHTRRRVDDDLGNRIGAGGDRRCDGGFGCFCFGVG